VSARLRKFIPAVAILHPHKLKKRKKERKIQEKDKKKIRKSTREGP
jgi:hypothetical protein